MILSGGGTAGHIYPALALASELRSRNIDLLYLGTAKGPEHKLAEDESIAFESISTAGYDRARPVTLITSSLKALRGVGQSLALLRRQKPAAVICFGGYVSVPVGLAASLCNIPLIVHEQNSYMGMTNRFLAKRSDLLALTYPETAGLPERLKAQVSCLGNPVRQSFLKTDPASARARLGIPNDAPVLLIFGGSRGARNINEAAIASAGLLLESYPDLHIIHGTGKLEHADVTEKLQQQLSARPQLAVRYHALPYIENMGDVIAASDLVVARAGATSIAELTVLGKPSVLIPYPYATDDHQTTNASALVDLGGARLITDAQIKQWLDNDLSETRSVETFVFAATLVKLMGDEQLRMNMAERAKTLGKADAAKKLADALQKVVAAN